MLQFFWTASLARAVLKPKVYWKYEKHFIFERLVFHVLHIFLKASLARAVFKPKVYREFQKHFYPPKGKAKRSQWGPLDSLSNLYVIGEVKFDFKNTNEDRTFLKSRKPLLSGCGGCDQKGPWIYLIFGYN